MEVHYAPKHRLLVWLSRGWLIGSPYSLPVADVMPGRHGDYSVMVWRELKEPPGRKA